MLLDDREDLVCRRSIDRLGEIVQPVESDMMLVTIYYLIDMLSFESFFILPEDLLRIFVNKGRMHSTGVVEALEEC